MHKRIYRHLLSRTGFEILVCILVRLAQGVEYDSLSILRIDHEYNPVAHDTQATQMKQDGSQILKQEKRNTIAIASII